MYDLTNSGPTVQSRWRAEARTPTFEDVIALTKALSGWDPTPDEVKETWEVTNQLC
jgi:hypothetical protein